MKPTIGIVILAAGLGTRMKTPDKAKVLHEICGQPMINYVVRTANAIAGPNVVVVIGHQAELVKDAVLSIGEASFALQERQLGTGHAVMCAMPRLPETVQQVVILCGDVPMIQANTIERLIEDHGAYQRDLSLLTVAVEDPKGYGRIILDGSGQLVAIVEEKDADSAQKTIKNINSGIYVVNREFLDYALPLLCNDNAQKEFYLTDIIRLGYQDARKIGAVMGADSTEIIGVNSRDDLKTAEKLMKLRGYEKS